MTDEAASGAQPGQLMSIGAVAAQNIAQALGYDEAAAAKIETAIKEEIDAMATHFTLAFAEIGTQHEVAQIALKKDYDKALDEAIAKFQEKAGAIRREVDAVKTRYENAISTHNYVRSNWGRLVIIAAGIFSLGGIFGIWLCAH